MSKREISNNNVRNVTDLVKQYKEEKTDEHEATSTTVDDKNTTGANTVKDNPIDENTQGKSEKTDKQEDSLQALRDKILIKEKKVKKVPVTVYLSPENANRLNKLKQRGRGAKSDLVNDLLTLFYNSENE